MSFISEPVWEKEGTEDTGCCCRVSGSPRPELRLACSLTAPCKQSHF